MHAKSVQLCLTISDPTNCSPSGSSGCGILQARIQEWGCHALLQGIFPTQGWKPCLLCLLHWQVGSLPLVPAGKPRVISTLIKLTSKFVNLLANLLTFNVSEDRDANGLCDPRIITVWRLMVV